MEPKRYRSLLFYVIVIAVFMTAYYHFAGRASEPGSYTLAQFSKDLKEERVASVTIRPNPEVPTGLVSAVLTDGQRVSFYDTDVSEIRESLFKDYPNIRVYVEDVPEESLFLTSILPILLIAGIMFLMMFLMGRTGAGGGANAQMMNFGKSRARMFNGKDNAITFNDVAGLVEEKQDLEEIVDFLKNPEKYTRVGARIPKGVILVGPPGTGKTLIAKAVAGEAGVPFFSISGSDFVEMFVGVGASRVRDMFHQAQQTAPCIIFIDEIDAVGRQRGAGFGGGHDEREQTLNQLLVEMDGMQDNGGIVVMAATNRPDVLDPALLRAGRFDRQITVSLPDRKGREAILRVHARNKHLSKDVDLGALAKRTPAFSGADLENVLNEAAILAVRDGTNEIGMTQIDEAIDRVMMGPAKKSRTYDEKTKKLIAYHEAGHAIIGLFLDNAQVVQKVTIIPRGQAGGYNLMTPKEEKMLNTKNDLMATITSYMGGRTAEEMFFDDVTTGASNDIERATNLAKDMVTLYGMSDLGPIKYNSGSENVFLGRDYNSPNNVSGQVAFEIDEEVRKIVNGCHNKARAILEEHRKELIAIAEALIEYETLTSEQIDRVIKGEPVEDPDENPEVPETKETAEPEAAEETVSSAEEAAPEAPKEAENTSEPEHTDREATE